VVAWCRPTPLRENKHRLASLDYIVQNGGVITDAVSSQKWPGEAKVHVSITNWIQQPTTPVTTFTLDGLTVSGITPQLKAGITSPDPKVLPQNKGRAFIGCQPTGPGFIVSDDTAATLITTGEQDVVRRYLTTDDITDSVGAEPRRWIIDFGTQSLEAAMKNPKALAVVRKEVKPERETNSQRHFARLWWQFACRAEDDSSQVLDLLAKRTDVSMEIANPVVDRGTLEVHVTMVKMLARITDQDNRELQQSYSRCSQWAKCHDKDGALNYVAPMEAELENELALVKSWFERVKKYKNN